MVQKWEYKFGIYVTMRFTFYLVSKFLIAYIDVYNIFMLLWNIYKIK